MPDEAPKAKGKAILRSDEELTALATVTDDDVDNARKFWRDKSHEQFKGLIEATADTNSESS